MGKIDLDFLQKQTPHMVEDDLSPNIVRGDKYTYKDIKFDLTIGKPVGNLPANRPLDTSDFDDLRDIDDLKQALINILNTKPGQKLLNPELGLDLTNFCFEPVSEMTGDLLARAIVRGLPLQEPRIAVDHLDVVADISNNTYKCVFSIRPVDSNLGSVQISSILDSDGFTLI